MRSIAETIADMPRPEFDGNEIYVAPETVVCPKCKGAGWLRLDVPLGHPSFGRLFRCECQTRTQNRMHATERRRISQLDGLEAKTFREFTAETPDQTSAFNAASAFAADLQGWIIFVGGVGTGKTHLAAAIANETLDRGQQSVMFAVVPDLLDYLRATFDPNGGVTYDARFTAVRTTFLLVLDDLGTENATPWAREKLYQIINHRYNERLPTVITTNRLDGGIDERILSRILDRDLSVRIALTGDDFRRRGDPGYMKGRR